MRSAPVRSLRRGACAALLALVAAPPMVAAESPSAVVARDVEAAWVRFLAEGDAAVVHPAYGVLSAVAYDGQHVDAEACGREAQALDAALAAAPVGIALQRVALLCAEAVGDSQAADVAADALSALARLAFASAGDADWSPPIRIVRIEDAYALFQTAGMDVRHAYFQDLVPGRHFPLRVAAWDAAAGRERNFVFDFIDVGYHIDRAAEHAGFPLLRVELAEAWIEALAPAEVAARDHQALLLASQAAGVAEKLVAVRDAAAAGGIQSTRTWIVLCLQADIPGCGEGLVDAILPHAEATRSLSMVHLAVAYAEGLGMEPDQGAADALLAAADRRSRPGDALVEYLSLRALARDGDVAEASRARLRALAGEGQPAAVLAFLAGGPAIETWPAGLAERLAASSFKSSGSAARLLAQHHRQAGKASDADAWLERAAALGDAQAQSELGFALVDAVPLDDARQARAEALLREAAHGGDIGGARYSAMVSARQGRVREAETWLLPAMRRGSAPAALDLARMVLRQPEPVTRITIAATLDMLRELAGEEGGLAEARQMLAEVLIDGIGTDKAPAEAEALLLVDAETGDVTSMAYLGSGYLRGAFGTRDVAAGRAWMERAVATGNPDAYAEFGSGLYYGGETAAERAEGIAWWTKGLEAGNDMAANNLAWAFCTSRHTDVQDARRGLEVARALEARIADARPSLVDTFAACHAAAGDHAQAVVLQQRAIDGLPKRDDGQPDDRSGYGDRLALYRAGRAYVELEDP
ncbi:sel1 repeat family protein [Luteimonas sp. MC1828]|uniref:sel1 repeat family protein n=1 Tax=Luteimonas sp. MC1828 TaxID=2799787 RepID=UPI0018F20E09|nr:sel1 repeat family protein [Luteimonas sp. MC1828]MBJ7575022.1 sel1 repeat family protein [Luteimonas sp. MC1828]